MAKVTFNGAPGATWTNDGPKVQYQLLVDWHNSCGLCVQYDHAVGPLWPTPFHRNCRCKQKPIWPGGESEPFVDFREKVRELDPVQQGRVVGRGNLRLIERGVVKWGDVVTTGRVRTLQEVISREKLTVDAIRKAGVPQGVADRAHQAVHTPPHELADAARKQAIRNLIDLGVGRADVLRTFGDTMATRVRIGAGPSERPPGWSGGSMTVGPRPTPLTPAELAAMLGFQWKTLPPPPKVTFVPSPNAEDREEPAVEVDVQQLDESWSKDTGYYIPPGGGEDKQKYRNAVAFLTRAALDGTPVGMPRITIDQAGEASFVDGRHRFAVMRDLGAKIIPVTIDAGDATRLQRAYGAK